MTTIAYRDGVIAVDGRRTENDLIVTDTAIKSYTYKDHFFVLCGDCSDMEGLMHAVVHDASDKRFEAGGLMVDPNGTLWTVGGEDTPWKARHDPDVPWACGSGRDFAIAAMDHGKSAKQAVKYAMTRNVYTGGKVRTYKVGG